MIVYVWNDDTENFEPVTEDEAQVWLEVIEDMNQDCVDNVNISRVKLT